MARRSSRWLIGLVVLAAVMATASCTGGNDDKGGDDPKASATTSSPKVSAPPKFSGVQHKLPQGKALKSDPDLYKEVLLTGCKKTDDGWRALGKATNSTKRAADYSILVFFTDKQARAIDSARTVVAVKPGKSANWEAVREFKAPPGVQCVVRAVANGS